VDDSGALDEDRIAGQNFWIIFRLRSCSSGDLHLLRFIGLAGVGDRNGCARQRSQSLRHRDVIEQVMRSEGRIDAWVLHFSNHRHALRRILGDEHGDLRIFEKGSANKFCANQVLCLLGLQTLDVQRAYQRQQDVAGVADPELPAELGSIEHGHFEQVASANRAGGAAAEAAATERGSRRWARSSFLSRCDPAAENQESQAASPYVSLELLHANPPEGALCPLPLPLLCPLPLPFPFPLPLLWPFPWPVSW